MVFCQSENFLSLLKLACIESWKSCLQALNKEVVRYLGRTKRGSGLKAKNTEVLVHNGKTKGVECSDFRSYTLVSV